MNIVQRPRRLRQSARIRDLVQETEITASDFVWPVFITEGDNVREPISALPGRSRVSVDNLLKDLKAPLDNGLKAVALFPRVEDKQKDKNASEALNPDGLVPRAIQTLKAKYPELCVISDVALDPYSSDGHDGLVKNGVVLNDESLLVLAAQAEMQARAGADFVAPSDMMDGRVGYIRRRLDEAGMTSTGIIAYTAKYASAFYGPFREALDSAPKFGDKKTYQMNPANRREALREARLDRAEGADMLMVKPALCYLDVISELRRLTDLPVAAYNVSGEYAMVKAASQLGWLDEERVVREILLSIKRAGADVIFSYHTPEVLAHLASR